VDGKGHSRLALILWSRTAQLSVSHDRGLSGQQQQQPGYCKACKAEGCASTASRLAPTSAATMQASPTREVR